MKTKILLSLILISLNSTAQIPSYVPLNGLVGWWPFNGNANDESGNGNNGTVNGATLTADRYGLANKAYSFDGVDNKIIISAQNNISQQSDYTLSLWFKSAVSTYNGAFVSFGTWFCKLGHDSPGFFYKDEIGNISNNWYEQAHFGVEPPINVWNNLILKKSSNNVTLILNNSIIGNMTTYGFTNFNPSSLIQFGYYCCQEYFSGSLDDVGFWNRALTEQEILALYQGCQMVITTQPINQNVNISGGSTTFNVASSASNPTYQWQTNLGLGFQNLSNAGQYSGVNTSSLIVSNLNMSNNNQTFRCIVSEDSCTDTSDIATLTVLDDASIDNVDKREFLIYPNPVKSDLYIQDITTNEEYQVFNVNGKLILSGKYQGKINVEELQKGTYFIEVNGQRKPFVKL